MAKKAAAVDQVLASISSYDLLHKEITKEFGDIYKEADSFVNKGITVIPIGPALDMGCGGVPSGSFLTMFGPPKVGKSITALQFACNAQNPKYATEGEPGGRHVYYHNLEHRIKPRDIRGIKGLDMQRFHILESIKGKILSAEEHLHIAEKEILSHPGCIVIFDSVAAMCTANEFAKEMDEQQRTDAQKLLAKFCRKVAPAVYVNDCVVVSITQLMGNPGFGGGGNKEKGGLALAYQVDTKLHAKWTQHFGKNLNPKECDGDPIGQLVHWDVVTSAFKGPGRKVESYLRYDLGIDRGIELFLLGLSLGLIDQAGAWYTLSFMQRHDTEYEEAKYKFQGKTNAISLLNDNPTLLEHLEVEIKGMLG